MQRTNDLRPLIKKFAQFWFTADFFAVGLFAYAGVAMRVGIQNELEGRIEVNPTQDYGPFLQTFYAKPYLLCNLIGCFVMSFCMTHMAQISAKSAPLYKGLTTGFCGCLTTFSSLMNDSVNVSWDGLWYKYILLLLVEFMLTWAAFTMGFACARIFDDIYAQVCPFLMSSGCTETLHEVDNVLGAAQGVELTAQDDTNHKIETAMPSNVQGDQYQALEQNNRNLSHQATNRSVCQNCLISVVAQLKRSSQPIQQFLQKYEYYILCTLFVPLCTVLWFVLIFESQLDYFNRIKVRNTYRAVALAPLGAWVRWGLTRFPAIKNIWPEMHLPTMIANLAGVTFMCLLVVFSTSSWVYAIDAGFNGSLTTVSTFFAELYDLYNQKGPIISLRYCLTTVGLSIAIIEIIRVGHAS